MISHYFQTLVILLRSGSFSDIGGMKGGREGGRREGRAYLSTWLSFDMLKAVLTNSHCQPLKNFLLIWILGPSVFRLLPSSL